MRLLPFLSLTLFACGLPAPDDTTDDGPPPIDPAGDEDNDGLTNGEEDDLGTEFDEADSDNDGFDDGDEIDDGTNPMWKWSHLYEDGDYLIGNCPVLPDEDDAGPTGTGSYDTSSWDAYQEGDVMHNLAEEGYDMYGQNVPVYSFCGNYTLVTESAEWCGPCQQLAAAMADDSEKIRKKYPNFTFYEYLYQNNAGKEPKESTLESWSDAYELEGIPVVSPEDNTADEAKWINATGFFPSTLLLAPDMTVIWSALDHPGEYYLMDAPSIKAAIADYEDSL